MNRARLLPFVGDEVLLSVPHTEQVLARVEGDGPGFFDLELLERPQTPHPQLVRRGLMIEFVNDDGVARLHGRLDVPPYQRGADARGTVRFAHRGSPQLLTRREFVRAEVELPLTLVPDGGEEPVSGTVHALDLSGGGMLAAGLQGARPGERYAFDLVLAEGEPAVAGRCEVARVVSGSRAGLRFTEIDHDDAVRVMHLAFEMSRAQRRRIA